MNNYEMCFPQFVTLRKIRLGVSMYGAGRRRSGADEDVYTPVRYGAVKNVCAPVRRRDGRKQDEYRKKEYGVLPPSRSV